MTVILFVKWKYLNFEINSTIKYVRKKGPKCETAGMVHRAGGRNVVKMTVCRANYSACGEFLKMRLVWTGLDPRA